VSVRASTPPRLVTGGVLLAALALLALLGPALAGDPAAIVDPPAAGLLPPLARRAVVELRDGSTLAGESVRRLDDRWSIVRRGEERPVAEADVAAVGMRRFWLGTDNLGRDQLARLLAGGRVSLAIGVLALTVALLIGTAVGLAAGWRGGALDAVLMRLADGLLAVPLLFLLILLAALFRPGPAALIAVLGLSSWMDIARLVRGQVLSLKEREYVLAARAIGASDLRIAVVHLLPNLAAPLAQGAALRLGDLILAEAALSFLGLGVQPPLASWGAMVAHGQEFFPAAWWLTFPAGLAVAGTVIGAALLADGVGEAARAESGPLT
jgi:peptide/nickel transport system permease protein